MEKDKFDKIKSLSDDCEVEIQFAFRPRKQVKVVISDDSDIKSFVSGWDNLIMDKIQSVCERFKNNRLKKEREVNKRLKSFEKDKDLFPDNLFKS